MTKATNTLEQIFINCPDCHNKMKIINLESDHFVTKCNLCGCYYKNNFSISETCKEELEKEYNYDR